MISLPNRNDPHNSISEEDFEILKGYYPEFAIEMINREESICVRGGSVYFRIILENTLKDYHQTDDPNRLYPITSVRRSTSSGKEIRALEALIRCFNNSYGYDTEMDDGIIGLKFIDVKKEYEYYKIDIIPSLPSFEKEMIRMKKIVSENEIEFESDSEDPDTVIIYKHRNREMTGSKCAGFDLDDTLTSGLAVTLYPGVSDKLQQLISDGYNIVIVSNQKRIGEVALRGKLERVSVALDIPFIAFCAREYDQYRKPNIEILSLIPEELGKMEFFVGDEAGRPGDHSDVDKKFAENAGIPFYTANDYFISGEKLDRSTLPDPLIQRGISFLTMVIMVGNVASGKTSWCKSMLPDYSYINRDTLGTMKKCEKKCEEELKNDNNVVIDNTNPTRESRKAFIELANKYGAQCICIHMNTSFQQCKYWNENRERKVAMVVLYTYRKRVEIPTLDEGFDYIYTVD